MADQKKVHIELSLELAEAARKMLELTHALPSGRQTPEGAYLKETVEGIVAALMRVDLTMEELDAAKAISALCDYVDELQAKAQAQFEQIKTLRRRET